MNIALPEEVIVSIVPPPPSIDSSDPAPAIDVAVQRPARQPLQTESSDTLAIRTDPPPGPAAIARSPSPKRSARR